MLSFFSFFSLTDLLCSLLLFTVHIAWEGAKEKKLFNDSSFLSVLAIGSWFFILSALIPFL